MPSYTLRMIALLMALLVMQSSTGLLVDMHFCKGEFKTFALFSKAKSCHSLAAKGNKKCLHHQKAAGDLPASFDVKKHNCCENHSFFKKNSIESSETLSDNFQIIQIDFSPVFFLQTDAFSEICSPEPDINQRVKPPPLGRDIRIALQSFLC